MTAIATKTGMDANPVPGMVTVLRGEEPEQLGIRTVFEAISRKDGIISPFAPLPPSYEF